MNNKWRLPAGPAFLEELRERARIYGWDGDFVEVLRFVEDLHREAGVVLPEEFRTAIEDNI